MYVRPSIVSLVRMPIRKSVTITRSFGLFLQVTYKPPAPKIAPPEQRVIVYEEPPPMTQHRVIMTPPPLMVYGTPPPMAPPQVLYGTPPPQQFIYEQPQVVYEQPLMYEQYEPAFGPPGFGNPQVVYEG